MKYLAILFLLLLWITKVVYPQTYTVNGYIRDAATGEALLFASCYDSTSLVGTTTNSYGFFNLSLAKGAVKITASYIGYQYKTYEFLLKRDTMISIDLSPVSKELQEVIVSARVPLHQQVIMGKTTITLETLEKMPSFVGEKDLMKAICYIPGISTGREGYSNVYVRGGDRGQNLILLDGAKLYNTNHVGGFISLFNSNIIKHLDVYKGGFPARYGGRASSVIDVTTKDGNKHEFGGKYSIGLLSSGILLEGPLRKDLSFLLAARTSYYDLFTIPARRSLRKTGMGSYAGYTFFDINAKINWQKSERNRLFLSFFTGHDYQKAEDVLKASFQESVSNQKINIHNISISLGQNYILTPKIFIKNSIAFSKYENTLSTYDKNVQPSFRSISGVNTFSNIDDVTIQSRFEYSPNTSHSIKAGVEGSYYTFVPGLQNTLSESGFSGTVSDTVTGFHHALSAYEGNVYVEDEISLSNNIRLNLGIRGTGYRCNDTVYFRAEPRVSFRWQVSRNTSFKANYSEMNQFNHVLVNNFKGFEKEIWMAATKNIPPQRAKQISVGVFFSSIENGLELSLESYYKTMSDLLEYKSPTSEGENYGNVENIVAKNGKGEAYGIEVQVNKNQGRVDLGLNYSLSWNYRQFKNLNNGKRYPFIYDNRHNLSIQSSVRVTESYSISSNFVLTSGMPFTLPEGYVKEDEFTMGYFVYEGINNRRLPIYHRLDISVVKKGKTRKGNRRQLEVNIFNVYARQNPVYIHYDVNTGKVYQKSLFSIIPTLSYSVEF